MKRTIYFLLLSLFATALWAQREQLTFYTDKDCYVAGERLHLSLVGRDMHSRVAYAELSDTAGLRAAATIDVDANGVGWAEMPLPANLHSGCYRLAVYTRLMGVEGTPAPTKFVGVVNTLRVSHNDAVNFTLPEAEPVGLAQPHAPGSMVNIALPSDMRLMIHTLSVVRNPLEMKMYESDDLSLTSPTGIFSLPELEGHVLGARAAGQVQNTRISAVGYSPMLFDGKTLSDGTLAYFTHGMTGQKPIMLTAYDEQGEGVEAQFISPYLGLLPAHLPRLEVTCNMDVLRNRSLGAQQENALTEHLQLDTLPHTIDFLSRMPDHIYDVDEYTRFNTVREAMFEYVRGVRMRKRDGRSQLFTSTADGDAYSHLPALVLLDGMPVNDVENVLAYDARLLKYIQVYSGSYTFGQTQCHGIISLITHRGQLSNYKLDAASQFVSYDFPQQRPDFLSPQTEYSSTVLWLPYVGSSTVDFRAPQLPGKYTVIVQGLDQDGKPFVTQSVLQVSK